MTVFRFAALGWIVAAGMGWAQTPGPAQAHMESIDTNRDGRADYAEFDRLYAGMTQDLFRTMDMNGDGYVQQAELDDGPAQYILDALGNTPWVPDLMADLDENGCVCYPEIQQILPGFPEATYRSLDRNGDGNLDLIEFNTDAAQKIIGDWEKKTIFLDFKTVDTNNDGLLSQDELRAALPDHDPTKVEQIDSVAAVKTDQRTVYYPVARLLQ